MFNSEVPYPERLLYAYLRSNIDYKTGIVGDADKKRISYQSIREALEFVPPQGSKTKEQRFDRDRIYKLLQSLRRRGLIEDLPKEPPTPGRRKTIRFRLPLSHGLVRPVEEGEMRATKEGDGKTTQLQLVSSREGDNSSTYEGDTSVSNSLSHYKYYQPDEMDAAWLGAALGPSVRQGVVVDLELETEKFNIVNRKNPSYDMSGQREDWRLWICRAVEYRRAQLR